MPTGIYALNRLGFSTQIPMNIVFLTDGYNCKVTLYYVVVWSMAELEMAFKKQF